MKSLIRTAALCSILLLLSGCAEMNTPYIFGCRSALEQSAACAKEAQGLSVHAKEWTIKAPEAHPAGVYGEWSYSGIPMFNPGSIVPVVIVHRPCESPDAKIMGCVNEKLKRIEIASSVPESCVSKIVAHEGARDGHLGGGTHDARHREYC